VFIKFPILLAYRLSKYNEMRDNKLEFDISEINSFFSILDEYCLVYTTTMTDLRFNNDF
jgi:hypothetical protein